MTSTQPIFIQTQEIKLICLLYIYILDVLVVGLWLLDNKLVHFFNMEYSHITSIDANICIYAGIFVIVHYS